MGRVPSWACLVGLVSSCYRAFVGISWVQIFFSWVFRGSKIFSRGYFLDPKFFLVGISWVQNFFSWAFCGSNIFSRGYFVGPKFSVVGNFVIFSCWPHEKKWHRNISQTRVLFQIDFNSGECCLSYKGTSSRKLLMLLLGFSLHQLYF